MNKKNRPFNQPFGAYVGYENRVFTVDGKRCSWRDLVSANAHDLAFIKDLKRLRVGEHMVVSDGAAASVDIVRKNPHRNPRETVVIIRRPDGETEVIPASGAHPARTLVREVRAHPGSEGVVASADVAHARLVRRQRMADPRGEWEIEAWAEEARENPCGPRRRRNPSRRSPDAPFEPGVYGDGAFGHRHVRERLYEIGSAVNEHAFEHGYSASVLGHGAPVDPEALASLLGEMPDDAWDENEVLDAVNNYIERWNLVADFIDGDLVIHEDDDRYQDW